MYAAAYGSTKAVRLLLDSGANVNAQDKVHTHSKISGPVNYVLFSLIGQL